MYCLAPETYSDVESVTHEPCSPNADQLLTVKTNTYDFIEKLSQSIHLLVIYINLRSIYISLSIGRLHQELDLLRLTLHAFLHIIII